MTGTDHTKQSVVGGPSVILVEPQLAENIGAAARAMLNCGLTKLIIVNPREEFPNPRADAMSAGATDVLNNAKIFLSVEEAIAGFNRVYATTARPREMIVNVVSPRIAAIDMKNAWLDGDDVSIMFGPERSGLTNDHIALADTVISVPLNPAYSSLNLAQAVLIISYEWFTLAKEMPIEKLVNNDIRPANKNELNDFFIRFESALDASGFFRSSDMRPSMVRNLRAMLQRATLTEQEIRTLHGVVSSLSGSWRETPNQLRKHLPDKS
jgi:tRNA/rRNA methyltransferase